MYATTIIPNIEKQLQLPLPGKKAQYKLATSNRMPYKKAPVPKDVRLASVLCLLYPKGGELFLPLIQRAVAKNDKHSGQMSFPGGKLEETDRTKADGALREANEEIGIRPEDVTILGELTPLYVPASNFQVFPFVGFLNYVPTFVPQESEVAEVVEVSLKELTNPQTLKYKNMKFRDIYTVEDVPYFDVNEKTVWGATGMMLSEFVEVVNQVNNSTK
ncbi:MAG: CoA pyrophosphatase [Bacteroidota bacterium]